MVLVLPFYCSCESVTRYSTGVLVPCIVGPCIGSHGSHLLVPKRISKSLTVAINRKRAMFVIGYWAEVFEALAKVLRDTRGMHFFDAED